MHPDLLAGGQAWCGEVADEQRGDERRAGFKRYKEDVQREGKPFFPYAMFHDTVMSFVVVVVIIGLACVWYYTTSEEPGDSGLLGVRLAEESGSGNDELHPAAGLVLLLPLLPAADLQVAGVGGPRHGRHPDAADDPALRTAVPRPASRAAALPPPGRGARRAADRGVDGRAHVQGRHRARVARLRGGRGRAAVVHAAGRLYEEEREGGEIFAQVGCLQCHTYLGSGSQNVGAPDLSGIGNTGRDAEFFARYVADPSQFGNNVMPQFERLGQDNLNKVGAFLANSKNP